MGLINMYNVFINNLKNKLKENIKGDIYVHVKDGNLIVTIEADRYTIYHYVKRDILPDIILGNCDSTTVYNTIHKQYVTFLKKKFFKKNW